MRAAASTVSSSNGNVSARLKDAPVVTVTEASSVRQDHTGPRFGRGQPRIHQFARKVGKRAVIGIVHAGWKLRLIRIKVASISDYRFV